MAYKIGDTALIIESNGQSVLIVKELSFGVDGTDSAGDFTNAAGGSVPNSFTLSDNFINNYFKVNHQGSSFGYASGGSPPFSGQNVIEKYSFTSDANSSDVGNLTATKFGVAGQSSSDNGYVSAGFIPSLSPSTANVIEKFPFSSDDNGSDVGDLTKNRNRATGQSSQTDGYTSGGYGVPPGSPLLLNVIDKFPFSSDANASDVGDTTVGRRASSSSASPTHGYNAGGNNPGSGTQVDVIDKFPFSSDDNATDVGNLVAAKGYTGGGQTSSSHGYVSGGELTSGASNVIEKFAFASDGNASDVGDLLNTTELTSGTSSSSNGYVAGGSPSTNVIQKFPFSSDDNSSDVGDLLASKGNLAGQQV